MTRRICIFDAYGTLFDVASAVRRLAAGDPRLTDTWPAVARDWRLKQLHYTWLRAVAGRHSDFAAVTADALDWALEAAGIADAGLRDRLLALYRTLDAYPEVPATLRALRAAGHATAILSNGTPDMLSAAVGAAGIAELLDDVLTVEAVGIYKPHPSVYDLVGARFGCSTGDVLFVSSNGWDAAAAAGYGFRTVWANRAGDPVDRLWATPDHVVGDLTPIPDLA